MPKKSDSLTQQQKRLIRGSEKHPELMARFLQILSIAEDPDEKGQRRTADEIESLMIEQTRLLGKETIETWAKNIEAKGVEQLKRDSSKRIESREKKR